MGVRQCPVCGMRKSHVIKKIIMSIPEDYHLPDSYDVAACEQCGMVYADTSASVEDYDWYYTHCNFYGDDSKEDNRFRYEMTKDFLEKYVKKSSVLLEMGAGNGRFCMALMEHGYENIIGTDPSRESVERLCKSGVKAWIENIYSDVSSDETEKYDGIFLFEVAEHLLLPGNGMENIERRLKNEGIFIISVPDYSLIEKDMNPIPNYFNLEHINYFSSYTLDYLMALNGMKRIDQRRFGMDLVQVYRKECNVEIPKKDMTAEKAIRGYLEHQEKSMERIEKIIDTLKDEGKEVVIWGTGSYTMSLFAATNLLECNIIGFVDNNKLKQGREIYGHKIYSPTFLEDKKAIVLVCSMLNGEEIKKQLEKMDTENVAINL